MGTIFEETGVRLRRPELDSIADRFAAGNDGWMQYSALLAAVGRTVGVIYTPNPFPGPFSFDIDVMYCDKNNSCHSYNKTPPLQHITSQHII